MENPSEPQKASRYAVDECCPDRYTVIEGAPETLEESVDQETVQVLTEDKIKTGG